MKRRHFEWSGKFTRIGCYWQLLEMDNCSKRGLRWNYRLKGMWRFEFEKKRTSDLEKKKKRFFRWNSVDCRELILVLFFISKEILSTKKWIFDAFSTVFSANSLFAEIKKKSRKIIPFLMKKINPNLVSHQHWFDFIKCSKRTKFPSFFQNVSQNHPHTHRIWHSTVKTSPHFFPTKSRENCETWMKLSVPRIPISPRRLFISNKLTTTIAPVLRHMRVNAPMISTETKWENVQTNEWKLRWQHDINWKRTVSYGNSLATTYTNCLRIKIARPKWASIVVYSIKSMQLNVSVSRDKLACSTRKCFVFIVVVVRWT